MKENVGRIDRIGRFLIGPAIVALGYSRLAGRSGNLAGLATMLAGALVVESAVTRVCPMNALLGLDTRSEREREGDLEQLLQAHARRTYERTPSGRTMPVARIE